MSGRRHKVMVLDDSDICREMTQLTLEAAGYDTVALEGPAALQVALGRERPDLVLLDVTMPALDEAGLARLVRACAQERCPVMLFSDRADEDLRTLARTCGAAGFLRKTAEVTVLTTAVERLLGAAS